MKLYTEEQLKNAMVNWSDCPMQDVIDKLNPIELPSKEEIEEKYYKELEERREVAKNYKGQVAGRHPDMFGNSEIHHMVRGYLEAIQSLRDKIQEGNK